MAAARQRERPAPVESLRIPLHERRCKIVDLAPALRPGRLCLGWAGRWRRLIGHHGKFCRWRGWLWLAGRRLRLVLLLLELWPGLGLPLPGVCSEPINNVLWQALRERGRRRLAGRVRSHWYLPDRRVIRGQGAGC